MTAANAVYVRSFAEQLMTRFRISPFSLAGLKPSYRRRYVRENYFWLVELFMYSLTAWTLAGLVGLEVRTVPWSKKLWKSAAEKVFADIVEIVESRCASMSR
jgi:hypothetical protein